MFLNQSVAKITALDNGSENNYVTYSCNRFLEAILRLPENFEQSFYRTIISSGRGRAIYNFQ